VRKPGSSADASSGRHHVVGTDHSTAERTNFEWVVEAPAGTKVGVVARHERAGTVRAELML
jgi:hypothetical protein